MENTSGLPRVARRQEAAFARVVERIREQPARSWTTAELANIAEYETIYFALLCRKLTGLSPMRLRLKVRLDEARSLLEHTSLSVGEIANRVGYSHYRSFWRAFRESYSETPVEYRSRHQGQPAAAKTEQLPKAQQPNRKELPREQSGRGYEVSETELQQLVKLIKDNLADAWSVADMTKIIGCSVTELLEGVKQVTGLAPQELVDQLRHKEAERLLRESTFSVTDICYQAGYGSMASFHKSFVRAHGLRPTEYRKSLDS